MEYMAAPFPVRLFTWMDRMGIFLLSGYFRAFPVIGVAAPVRIRVIHRVIHMDGQDVQDRNFFVFPVISGSFRYFGLAGKGAAGVRVIHMDVQDGQDRELMFGKLGIMVQGGGGFGKGASGLGF